MTKIKYSRLPRHIAIIMDGNGRWARKRGLPRLFGHRQGVKAVKKIVEECARLKIEVLTLYAFSNENWSRPKTEVLGLMLLLEKYLIKELENLNRNNVKLMVSGELSQIPDKARHALEKSIVATHNNSGLKLNLALNYGSRQEIIKVINTLLQNRKTNVDEEMFSRQLYTSGIPDPDLVIRTSGEKRISNFLLWQIAYSELYFTDTLWPDFGPDQLRAALDDFAQRERRFGGIGVVKD